jgi:enterochelin esterase family protein
MRAVLVSLLAAALELGADPAIDHIAVSPEVEGGMVTFRLRAPRAREVILQGPSLAAVILQRDADGVWSGRVGPLPPGIYEYRFKVDGLQMPDPLNPWRKPSWRSGPSLFEVPGGREDYEAKGAPAGALVIREYHARGQLRRIHVYTPAVYEHVAPLPVVYLLHGYSDTDATWYEHGRVHRILDNLIAERRLRPVVVVMPDGHALAFRDGQETAAYVAANQELFVRELRDEIVPLVERSFHVIRNAAARAVIGFAMGADQALACADGFGATAAVDPRVPEAERVVAHLQARGIKAVLRRTGGDRKQPTYDWRRQLAHLLPELVGKPGR